MLDYYSQKIQKIQSCIIGSTTSDGVVVNLWELRELALTKGGFVSREMRQLVWPILTGVTNNTNVQSQQEPYSINSQQEEDCCSCFSDVDSSSSNIEDNDNNNNNSVLVDHAVLEIIQRDVRRTVWRLVVGQQEEKKEEEEEKDRQQLVDIICSVLGRRISTRSNSIERSEHQTIRGKEDEEELYYYQGFHDICSLIHINLSSSSSAAVTAPSTMKLSAAVISQLCQRHFRDAMRINFNKFVRGIQLAFWPLLSQVDPTMEAHMFKCHYTYFYNNNNNDNSCRNANNEGSSSNNDQLQHYYADKLITPVSIVSWTMTWFASQLGNFETVASRWMDAFMASHALLPLYVAVALLSYNHNDILSCDCDFASIHMQLVRLPRTTIEELIIKNKRPSTTNTSAMDNNNNKSDNNHTHEEEEMDDFCQHILDTALTYMKRFPPWHLIQLSKTYRGGLLFRSSNPKKTCLFDHSDISMFDTPASWSTCATTRCYSLSTDNHRLTRNSKTKTFKQQTITSSSNTLHKPNKRGKDVKRCSVTTGPQFSLAKVASGYCGVATTTSIAKWQQAIRLLKSPRRKRTCLLLKCGGGLLFIAKLAAIMSGKGAFIYSPLCSMPQQLCTTLETYFSINCSTILSQLLPHSWHHLILPPNKHNNKNSGFIEKYDEIIHPGGEDEPKIVMAKPNVVAEILQSDKAESIHNERREEEAAGSRLASGVIKSADYITNTPNEEAADMTFTAYSTASSEVNNAVDKEPMLTLIRPKDSQETEKTNFRFTQEKASVPIPETDAETKQHWEGKDDEGNTGVMESENSETDGMFFNEVDEQRKGATTEHSLTLDHMDSFHDPYFGRNEVVQSKVAAEELTSVNMTRNCELNNQQAFQKEKKKKEVVTCKNSKNHLQKGKEEYCVVEETTLKSTLITPRRQHESNVNENSAPGNSFFQQNVDVNDPAYSLPMTKDIDNENEGGKKDRKKQNFASEGTIRTTRYRRSSRTEFFLLI